jgi:hypothetical protein
VLVCRGFVELSLTEIAGHFFNSRSPKSQVRGFKTVAEFVAAARAKPGAMNFATPGVGTGLHLSALRFQTSAGMQAVPVTFKGGPESMAEVIDWIVAQLRIQGWRNGVRG